MRKIIVGTLVLSIVVFSMPIAPLAQLHASRTASLSKPLDISMFLRDMGSTIGEGDDVYSAETKKIASILTGPAKKSPILIDRTGNDRELIIQAAASRLAASTPSRTVLAIDWNALFSAAKSEADVADAVKAIIAQAELSKGREILYVDDVSIFSKERPLLGRTIAEQFYEAIAAGRVRVLAGTNPENFV